MQLLSNVHVERLGRHYEVLDNIEIKNEIRQHNKVYIYILSRGHQISLHISAIIAIIMSKQENTYDFLCRPDGYNSRNM